MRIAIIGSGISGLGAAYILNTTHDITVYEKNDYIGGHSRTITVRDQNKDVPVDTGFIVFNNRCYPLLKGLFEHLKVPVIKSDMSFGVSISNSWLEYGSKSIFGQRKNIFRYKFWGMILDIIRFNSSAKRFIDAPPSISLEDCLNQLKLGDWFKRYYLQAMGAAIWSCSIDTILKFPASSFVRFFENHGLLTVNSHPQWYTVKGGSREYIEKLTHEFKDKIRLHCGVNKVTRNNGRVQIQDDTRRIEEYDSVVFACHADQALKMLETPSQEEENILGAFSYQDNKIIVHTDTNFMPRRKDCWASWVYLSNDAKDSNPVVSLSYWMNNLQDLKTEKPIFVTLNPSNRPQEESILDEHIFSHPVFTKEAVEAQALIDSIQGFQNTWYCGAYQRYGFHEDGLLSSVRMTKKMGITAPWK